MKTHIRWVVQRVAPLRALRLQNFDIVLDPDFDANQTVYLSYAGGTPKANGTTIIKAKLEDNSFTSNEVIFSAQPTKDTPQHYGGK